MGRRVYDGVLGARAAWRSGVVSTRAEVRHEISTHLTRVPGADQPEFRSETARHVANPGLRRNVDLVDLTQASPVLAVQVIGRGLLVDDIDRDARARLFRFDAKARRS